MEHKALRESTSRLGQRMKDLDRRFDGVVIGSYKRMTLYLLCLGQLLAMCRSPYMTCARVWMPLSLSLIIFAFNCFCCFNDLQLMRWYSSEMERVGTELSENRRRLLELGMDDDAVLAEIAGMWKYSRSTIQAWVILLCFVVFSVLCTHVDYTLGCDR